MPSKGAKYPCLYQFTCCDPVLLTNNKKELKISVNKSKYMQKKAIIENSQNLEYAKEHIEYQKRLLMSFQKMRKIFENQRAKKVNKISPRDFSMRLIVIILRKDMKKNRAYCFLLNNFQDK